MLFVYTDTSLRSLQFLQSDISVHKIPILSLNYGGMCIKVTNSGPKGFYSFYKEIDRSIKSKLCHYTEWIVYSDLYCRS